MSKLISMERWSLPREQLAKIVDIDETRHVLDGSKCNEITFYSPKLCNLGKATIKTSVANAMITSSPAAEEPILSHFQF